MILSALVIILQLIYLESILSFDNAAVLAAMVRRLPRDAPIPWPNALRFVARPVHRMLGGQRLAALQVGLLGAYVGRGAMLILAAWVIHNRWLLLAGGLYLIKLAVDHLGERPQGARAAPARGAEARGERGFWGVVLAVEVVDLAFSLDNVVAAVALSRELWVVMTGVFLGIVAMRVAAGAFSSLIARYPVLEATAYVLILMIGIELLAEDLFQIRLGDLSKFAISLGTVLLSLIYSQQRRLQQMGRRMMWLKRSLGYVAVLFDAVLTPVLWMERGGVAILRAIGVRRRRGQAAPASSIRGAERRRSVRSDRPRIP
ncbi:MAG TPA: tellurium resistance protein TerC [bacterium]|nr:tellurium resistance protein TerC [bacterium]